VRVFRPGTRSIELLHQQLACLPKWTVKTSFIRNYHAIVLLFAVTGRQLSRPGDVRFTIARRRALRVVGRNRTRLI